MVSPGILTEEFADAAALAGRRARESALAAGYSVIYWDSRGRYVEELPDGRRNEILFRPGAPRDSHVQFVREIPAADV